MIKSFQPGHLDIFSIKYNPSQNLSFNRIRTHIFMISRELRAKVFSQFLTVTPENKPPNGVEIIFMRIALMIFQDELQKNLQKNSDIQEIFQDAFLRADKQLNENAGKHSGCTAVTAFLRSEPETIKFENENEVNGKDPSACNANVGDARAVLNRDGRAVRLSYDHKGSDAQEAKRIVEAGGFVMNNRVNGVLAVTRSLGDCSMKEFVIGKPYTTKITLTEKDSFLILACDGLWDVCNDQEAVDLIKDIMDPQEASTKLIRHALQNFSTDNLSVM
ncbi:13327_t:CDS:2, partial [Dentiscutata erythropus]